MGVITRKDPRAQAKAAIRAASRPIPSRSAFRARWAWTGLLLGPVDVDCLRHIRLLAAGECQRCFERDVHRCLTQCCSCVAGELAGQGVSTWTQS